jgi:hypothetical protein
MQILTSLQSFLDPFLLLISQDPLLRVAQAALLLIGLIDVFFVFFTTRDILLRTRSFTYMASSIILVAILPYVGFLLYLLVRPARTLMQRETDRMVRELHSVIRKQSSRSGKEKSGPR